MALDLREAPVLPTGSVTAQARVSAATRQRRRWKAQNRRTNMGARAARVTRTAVTAPAQPGGDFWGGQS